MDDRSRTRPISSWSDLSPYSCPQFQRTLPAWRWNFAREELHLDGRIPQNLLTTLVRQAKRSRFLPPLFIMFTTAFQRQFDGGKKCWPRCRYRTMILMMGSKRTEPNHKQKQKNQGNDKKTLGRGQLQQIAGMPMLIINNFYIFATSLGGFASQLKGELQWQGYLLCQPAKGHDNNP